MLNNHVVNQVGPERNFGHKVEELRIHQKVKQIILDSH
jgi:hypothetical protein